MSVDGWVSERYETGNYWPEKRTPGEANARLRCTNSSGHGCNVECCILTIWLVPRVYAKMNTRNTRPVLHVALRLGGRAQLHEFAA